MPIIAAAKSENKIAILVTIGTWFETLLREAVWEEKRALEGIVEGIDEGYEVGNEVG